MSYFRDAGSQVRTVWREDGGGLRTGQLGALWALGSHFTVSRQPVQAVLPTGAGKTAVVCLVPFVVPTSRVLIVAPSRLVRDQIADQFSTLAVLRQAEVVPDAVNNPRVRVVEHRVRTEPAWQEFEAFDVVVGTPGVLSDAYPDVAPIPKDLFDLVLIDEGHHTPAPTWCAILDGTRGVRVALFTATPFRRDRQGIPADIAYAYPLGQAIAEGVYEPIQFVPVEASREDDHDAVLAQAAAARLTDPRHVAGGSAVLVRTDSIREAERLVEVYRAAGVEIGVVHSRQPRKVVQDTIERLRRRQLRGVASVSILGEGFDLPMLKIAVYHQAHKSLAATLQFVGRIARVEHGSTRPPAELLAIRREVQDETRQLYESDRAWAELLPAISEAAVQRERERREYVRHFREPVQGEFSMFALRPKLQAQIFEVPEGATVRLPTELTRLASGEVVHAATDETGSLLSIVTVHRVHPAWLQSSALDTEEFDLHLVYYDRARGLLFLSTSSQAACQELLAILGARNGTRVSPTAMNRILHGIKIQGYSSIGLRSAWATSGRQASYKTMSGPTVHQAVLPGDARGYGIGHVIGQQTGPDNRATSLGVSVRKAKVWFPVADDLLGYKEWCDSIAALVRSTSPIGGTAPLLPISWPQPLERYPALPIGAGLDHALLHGDVLVRTRDGGQRDITHFDLVPVRVDDETCRLEFSLEGELEWSCLLCVDGRVHPVGHDRGVSFHGHPASLTTLLTEFSPTLYFADGSTTREHTLCVPAEDIPPVPNEVIQAWDWSGVDVHKEVRAPKPGSINVQTRTEQWVRDTMASGTLIADGNAGELADLLVLQDDGAQVDVRLIHCKWTGYEAPSHRVDDVHVVLCQAMRSARWTIPRVFWTELDRRFNERAATKVLNQDPVSVRERVRQWAAEPPATRFHIVVVQPGLLIDGVTKHDGINTMLVSCLHWISGQGATLLVVGA